MKLCSKMGLPTYRLAVCLGISCNSLTTHKFKLNTWSKFKSMWEMETKKAAGYLYSKGSINVMCYHKLTGFDMSEFQLCEVVLSNI